MAFWIGIVLLMVLLAVSSFILFQSVRGVLASLRFERAPWRSARFWGNVSVVLVFVGVVFGVLTIVVIIASGMPW